MWTPEQATGRAISPQSDIYSLGATAYYLLTGQPPFVSRQLDALIDAHLHLSPVPLQQLNPNVPMDLQEIVLQCLEKAPERRFVDANDLSVMLEKCRCATDRRD